MSGGETGRRWLAEMLWHHRLGHLRDTPATRRLPRFQRDGAVRLLDLLEQRGGAVLADDVGLGKTFTALAVLASRPDWRPALLVAPAAVLPAWRAELGTASGVVETASYARLSRGLVRPPPGGFGLVVFDEAHRLRNPATRRYSAAARLADEARVLLVTASPIHNRLRDLAALIELFVPSAGGDRDPDELRWAASCLVVRRTRWTVTTAYAAPHRQVPGGLEVPERRRAALVVAPTPELEALLTELPRVAEALTPDGPKVARGLLTVLLARRLESSPPALVTTLQRCRNYLVRAEEAAQRGERLSRGRFRALFGDDPSGQLAQYLLPFFFAGNGAPAAELTAGLPEVDRALERARGLAQEVDPKLTVLEARLGSCGADVTVAMTEYEDTARHLFRRLGGERLLLTGRGAWSSRLGRVDRDWVLRELGPGDGAIRSWPAGGGAGVLVATDVLREGVNLQAADRLVHYDLPWSPQALAQRFGRVDRLGARGRVVEEVSLYLGGRFEAALALEPRLRRKRAAARSVLAVAEAEELAGVDVRLSPGQGERVGVDLDGFLMACAARTELDATALDATAPRLGKSAGEGIADASPSGDPGSGWLVAVEADGWVGFYWAAGGAVREAPPRLLLALANGRVEAARPGVWGREGWDPEAEGPGDALIGAALLRAARARGRQWILAREPAGPGRLARPLREWGAELARRARAAQRDGDVRTLREVEQRARAAEGLSGARRRLAPGAVPVQAGRATGSQRDLERPPSEPRLLGALWIGGSLAAGPSGYCRAPPSEA